MICRFCNSDGLVNIRPIKSPIFDEMYHLYRCNYCHCLQFDPSENNHKDLLEMYELIGEERVNETPFSTSPYWKEEVKRIKSLFGGDPKTILDVGCRTGDFLLHWPMESERMGVEINSRARGIAQSRGLTVYETSAETIRFDEKFDVVGCYAIIEHLSQPIPFLDSLTSATNYGGVIAILIPSYQTLKAYMLGSLRIRWHMYSPPEHLNFFSRFFLDKYFASRGFILRRRRYTSGGMFNPFMKIPKVRGAFSRLMLWIDYHVIINRIPIFDHLYCYYQKCN